MSDLPEHVRKNRETWDKWANDYIAAGERAWAMVRPAWGIWHVPEAEGGMLLADLAQKDAIELRMRHRLRLRMAGEARGAGGRN